MSNTEINSKTTNLYTIEFEHRPKYLYAFISGKDDSLDITRSYWLEMLEECRQHNFDKLLVEEALEQRLSMQEIYQFASEFPQFGFHQLLIAFVDRYPAHQRLNRFGETVANNRGGRVRIFDTVSDAKQWLLTN